MKIAYYRIKGIEWIDLINVNPSFSKPFGTHTSYQGGVEPTPQLSQKPLPHEPEILQGFRDAFESLRNVKVVYIVFTWLP